MRYKTLIVLDLVISVNRMAELNDGQVPIYRRQQADIEHPELVTNDCDVHLAGSLLYPQKFEDRFSRSYDILHDVGAPKLTIVGNSHVQHW